MNRIMAIMLLALNGIWFNSCTAELDNPNDPNSSKFISGYLGTGALLYNLFLQPTPCLSPCVSTSVNPEMLGAKIGNTLYLATPSGIVIDSSGVVYVSNSSFHSIQKISSAGGVSLFAGTNYSGFVETGTSDGIGTSARFSNPKGVAIDNSGNIYVADMSNHKIRKITSSGNVSTFAGSGVASFANATGTSASFDTPSGIAADSSGNVYVADSFNHSIRKITPLGVVSTLAGSGTIGSTDGTGTSASFNTPRGVCVDSSGNIYVADTNNHKIRKITSFGVVTTLAGSNTAGFIDGTGTSASFNSPFGLGVDSAGNIYVADTNNHKIRKITSLGVVSNLAGSGTAGSKDGTATSASFNSPLAVGVDSSNTLYIADTGNYQIRKITQ